MNVTEPTSNAQARDAGPRRLAHLRRRILEPAAEVPVQEQAPEAAARGQGLRGARSVLVPGVGFARGAEIGDGAVGISTPEMRIGTYKEFTRDTLPRIHKLGYNTIQLMCVQAPGRCPTHGVANRSCWSGVAGRSWSTRTTPALGTRSRASSPRARAMVRPGLRSASGDLG